MTVRFLDATNAALNTLKFNGKINILMFDHFITSCVAPPLPRSLNSEHVIVYINLLTFYVYMYDLV